MDSTELLLIGVGTVLLAPSIMGIGSDIRGAVTDLGTTIKTATTTTNAWFNYANPNTWIGSNNEAFWS